MKEIFIYKKTNERHNYKIVLWRADEWKYSYHLASFNDIEQLETFLDMLGVEYSYLKTLNEGDSENEIKVYLTNYTILDSRLSFWKLEDLPKNATKFKALSNGSIVDCYFKKFNKAKTIYIYRPNPNAKGIYKPLSLEKHIAFKKLYGTY